MPELVRRHNFGIAQGYELGWSDVGQPWMSVFVWVVGHVLIDSGLSHLRRQVLELARAHEIEAVLLTHHHEDHSGNAGALKAAYGLPVLGHLATQEKLATPFRILPYQHWVWGPADPVGVTAVDAPFEAGGHRFEPVHTPGHSRDHTVYWMPEHGCMFSGDLYLADRIKYFRCDEDIAEQIVSLKKAVLFDVDVLFCAHHPQRAGGRERLLAKLQFLEEFYGRIGQAVDAGCDGVEELMRRAAVLESLGVRAFTFGNASARQMVKSAVRCIERTRAVDLQG
ncbi:MAG: hypothetical protein A2341_25525 [Deltaproteobacteria bacterium RIFOXYB12_FULL_58_9]|nr:MAG: hypothetical protein A2341_25525 [Deltaproteobacteria bacterium RIFOXYB12_FULL_58_9]